MSKPYPVTQNDYDTFRNDAEQIIQAFDKGQYYAKASQEAQSNKWQWMARSSGGLETCAFILAVRAIHSLDFPKKIIAFAEGRGLKHMNKIEDITTFWHDMMDGKSCGILFTHLMLDGAQVSMELPRLNKPILDAIPLLNIKSDNKKWKIDVVGWWDVLKSLESLFYFLEKAKP